MAKIRFNKGILIWLFLGLVYCSPWSLAHLAFAEIRGSVPSQAEWGWQLPIEVSDKNCNVSFEVDSTWHLIQGKTASNTGRVWLENPNDPLSIGAIIKFPVTQFNTDSTSRDERLREVMKSQEFSEVELAIRSVTTRCSVEEFQSSGKCFVSIDSSLSIRGVTKVLSITADVYRTETSIEVSGVSQFSWLDFGVEDPSILIAKLDPMVKVSFKIEIPRKKI